MIRGPPHASPLPPMIILPQTLRRGPIYIRRHYRVTCTNLAFIIRKHIHRVDFFKNGALAIVDVDGVESGVKADAVAAFNNDLIAAVDAGAVGVGEWLDVGFWGEDSGSGGSEEGAEENLIIHYVKWVEDWFCCGKKKKKVLWRKRMFVDIGVVCVRLFCSCKCLIWWRKLRRDEEWEILYVSFRQWVGKIVLLNLFSELRQIDPRLYQTSIRRCARRNICLTHPWNRMQKKRVPQWAFLQDPTSSVAFCSFRSHI